VGRSFRLPASPDFWGLLSSLSSLPEEGEEKKASPSPSVGPLFFTAFYFALRFMCSAAELMSCEIGACVCSLIFFSKMES
jgi:hypothetical protein